MPKQQLTYESKACSTAMPQSVPTKSSSKTHHCLEKREDEWMNLLFRASNRNRDWQWHNIINERQNKLGFPDVCLFPLWEDIETKTTLFGHLGIKARIPRRYLESLVEIKIKHGTSNKITEQFDLKERKNRKWTTGIIIIILIIIKRSRISQPMKSSSVNHGIRTK